MASADVTDGMSNTLLLVESAGRPTLWRRSQPIGDPYNTTNPVRVNGGGWARAASDFDLKGSSSDGSVFPGSCAINCTNGDDIGNNYPDPVYGTNGTGETYAFHAGGANVLFGDGSDPEGSYQSEVRCSCHCRPRGKKGKGYRRTSIFMAGASRRQMPMAS
jgi:prepilin-type processing-associated H-X9-DG protein